MEGTILEKWFVQIYVVLSLEYFNVTPTIQQCERAGSDEKASAGAIVVRSYYPDMVSQLPCGRCQPESTGVCPSFCRIDQVLYGSIEIITRLRQRTRSSDSWHGVASASCVPPGATIQKYHFVAILAHLTCPSNQVPSRETMPHPPGICARWHVLRQIYHESTDTDLLEHVLARLLHHCGRFTKPKSVIAMDNASWHHSEDPADVQRCRCGR